MSNWSRSAAAMGVPHLPERAFRVVGPHQKIQPQGDSGGGSAPANTTTTTIPEYARPYVEEMLGKASALTSQPYQNYTGERTAQFTPLQQQAFGTAGGLQTAPQIGQASGLAGIASLGALGTNYDPAQTGQFTGQTAAGYMNPYFQTVVGNEQREAQRQADIASTQRNAQAVSAGAFGGSRQAIMDAEAARGLQSQLGDIQAKGLQTAYSQGQQQFNTEQALREQSRQFGADTQLKGFSTALTGAGTLGQLGSTQVGQQMDIANMQNTLGGQQQKQVQDVLSQQYQDFLNQQNSPYKNLGFMSDLLRGTSATTQQATQMYQPGPSTAQSLIGLGTAAAGLSKLKRGGRVKSAGLADLAIARMG